MKFRKFIKLLLKRIVWRYRADSASYVKWLRKQGCQIGDGTQFIEPRNGWCDITNPWLVEIGNNVTITPGVVILTHDYGWSVITGVYGDIIGNIRPCIIGNNVFIGTNSILLGGATIGDNVIIGANSTVSGTIPNNCVAAGSPAKVICSLEQYREKRLSKYCAEAQTMLRIYFNKFHQIPSKEFMMEHYWLFENNLENLSPKIKDTFNWVKGSKHKSIERFLSHNKTFENYGEFVSSCNINN